MMSTVIGGAMLPHAPQFFTMPDTEDKNLVAHVREVAADIGTRLKALNPDLWIIFSNDHAEQFFHNAAPPFTVHVGGEASGEFSGRKFHWKIPSEIGFEIVRQLYRQNFDPAFTSTLDFTPSVSLAGHDALTSDTPVALGATYGTLTVRADNLHSTLIPVAANDYTGTITVTLSPAI